MKKRVSLRRWKARCRLGREIPREAIINHRLTQWFMFTPAARDRDVHWAFAEATGEVVTEWEYVDPITGKKDGHLYRREPSGEFVRIEHG